MLVVIVGKIATGKSTLKKGLMEHGFQSMITYTTRAPRPGEEDGVDYHFISSDEFMDKLNNKSDFFLEAKFDFDANNNPIGYGSAVEDYERYAEGGNWVVILDPAGVEALKRHGISATVLYLRALETTCINNALKRGDDYSAVVARMASDAYRFIGFERELNYSRYVNVDDMAIEEVLQWALSVEK